MGWSARRSPLEVRLWQTMEYQYGVGTSLLILRA